MKSHVFYALTESPTALGRAKKHFHYIMTEILKKCVDFIRQEGFPIEKENENHFRFKYQAKHYFIEHTEKDEMFLRIILPGFYSISADEELQALKIINDLTRQKKVIKLHIDEDRDLWASAELFIDENTYLPPIIIRGLDLIATTTLIFCAKMID